jgi:hypothetical protein
MSDSANTSKSDIESKKDSVIKTEETKNNTPCNDCQSNYKLSGTESKYRVPNYIAKKQSGSNVSPTTLNQPDQNNSSTVPGTPTTPGQNGMTTPTTPMTPGQNGMTTPRTPMTPGRGGMTTPSTPMTPGQNSMTTPRTPMTPGRNGMTTPRTPMTPGSDDMPRNGMPMNGMPMNGMPMNGMPMNGMPMNGMPMNGMPMNGMPMNGMPMNGMPMNGMPMNGMPMNDNPYNVPMGIPLLPLYGYDNSEDLDKDIEYMRHLYPNTAKLIQRAVEDECDKLEYDGSVMFDEYPDKTSLDRIIDRIYEKMKDMDEDDMQIETKSFNPSRRRRNFLRDLITIVLLNEIFNRRRRYRSRRRWF